MGKLVLFIFTVNNKTDRLWKILKTKYGQSRKHMMDRAKMSYTANLDFETIKLPPVTDILVLGKKVPQGKQGILHSFELILPDTFVLHEINES